MTEQREQSDEKGAPVAHVVTEYALAHDVGHGLILATGPNRNPRWNETITLEEAAERWFPGAIVVTRTVTTFEPVVTDWSRVTRPGREQSDG
ncbi:hypothetical protein [Nocardioides sp. Leaf285]|uniref:hypothetical protein n=1 Tax=Nocardioides sp. Leaf285 TaxID=1736322 RepID=UPI000702B1A9|nr:hypothetical protein [Nocardioides sp. Leaf285]KQP63045.1 hypothetical protein ASF47_18715 [Nocardioides sp. Leaf285]